MVSTARRVSGVSSALRSAARAARQHVAVEPLPAQTVLELQRVARLQVPSTRFGQHGRGAGRLAGPDLRQVRHLRGDPRRGFQGGGAVVHQDLLVGRYRPDRQVAVGAVEGGAEAGGGLGLGGEVEQLPDRRRVGGVEVEEEVEEEAPPAGGVSTRLSWAGRTPPPPSPPWPPPCPPRSGGSSRGRAGDRGAATGVEAKISRRSTASQPWASAASARRARAAVVARGASRKQRRG